MKRFAYLSSFRALALVCLTTLSVLNPHALHAQTDLGWWTFDYGVSQPLGSITVFDGELSVSSRVGLLDYYTGAGSTTNGTASSVYYQHDDNPLVGGLAASPSGTRGDVDLQELLFQFTTGSARMDSMSLVINGLSFGPSAYDSTIFPGYNLDGDDPMLWFNTSAGVVTFTEQEVLAATSFYMDGTDAGATSGFVDFAYFASSVGMDTTVTSFAVRETNGDTWVKDIYVGGYTGAAAVPEPGAFLPLALGALTLLRRRRRTPSSLQRAVV